jgi:hypothetical protein
MIDSSGLLLLNCLSKTDKRSHERFARERRAQSVASGANYYRPEKSPLSRWGQEPDDTDTDDMQYASRTIGLRAITSSQPPLRE